jgi:hypothetical protein
VRYGSVVTKARRPGIDVLLELGVNASQQIQHALYFGLYHLAAGYRYPAPSSEHHSAMLRAFGEVPDSDASDGIVPTLSQPWGAPVAVVPADHLDIIGHYAGDDPAGPHHDWLTTRSRFDTECFESVWQRVASFLREAEAEALSRSD